ncbi:TRP-domain-containing protein [Neoconidiobolus thromboides FSU 785]|nr:TRP-domain-containing protein [Neoconidiobolus thromboides FSU 785]
MLKKVLFLLIFTFNLLLADNINLTSSLVQKCDKSNSDNSKLDIKDFSIAVDSQTNTLNINLNMDLKQALSDAKAVMSVNLFGEQLFTTPTIDLCSNAFGTSICPIQPGTVAVPYKLDLPSAVSSLANTLTKIPGANLSASLKIVDSNNVDIGCVAVNLANPVSGQQPAILGTIAGIAGFSSIVSVVSAIGSASMLAVLPLGMSYQVKPGPTPSFFDVISTFQFMGTTGMLSLNYPDLYKEYTTNLGWTMGMVNIPAVQSAINNFRPKASLRRRDIGNFLPDTNAKTYSELAGVQSYANKLRVQPENYFLTVLIIFACLMGAITVLILLLRLVLELLALYKPKMFRDLRNYYANYYIGNLLRVFLLTYFFLATAALFQLTLKDYLPITIIAGVVLGLFCVLLMIIVTALIIKTGPIRLYTEPKLSYTYGPFYSDYRQPSYLFFILVIVTSFLRACAVGLLGNYVWAQLGILVGVEVLFFIAIFALKPYAAKLGNTLMIFIGVIKIANLGLLFFYVQSFTLPELARTIIAIAMIVLQGVIMLAITLLTLWGLVSTIRKLVKGEKIVDEPLENEFQNTSGYPPRNEFKNVSDENVPYAKDLEAGNPLQHGEKRYEGEPLMMDYYRSKSPHGHGHGHSNSLTNNRTIEDELDTSKSPILSNYPEHEGNFEEVELPHSSSKKKGLRQEDIILP